MSYVVSGRDICAENCGQNYNAPKRIRLVTATKIQKNTSYEHDMGVAPGREVSVVSNNLFHSDRGVFSSRGGKNLSGGIKRDN